MSDLSHMVTKIRALRRLWRERAYLYSLVMSDNYRFVRFAPPGHFYSPIPDTEEVETSPSNGTAGIDCHTEAQFQLLQEFAKFYAEMPLPEQRRDGYRFHLDNGYFAYGDAVILYSMMRRFQPKRIIEVGSGFSSAAMLDIRERFFGGALECTFIEPFPERLLSLLASKDNCQIIQSKVQDVPVSLFDQLEDNDILFIDSSHVAKASSDVLHLCFNILPALSKGVLIHFHHILWPFEYPKIWFEEGRAWNEAYLVRAFLQFNNVFQIVYFNSMIQKQHGAVLRAALPLAMNRPSSPVTPSNSSLWLRKVG